MKNTCLIHIFLVYFVNHYYVIIIATCHYYLLKMPYYEHTKLCQNTSITSQIIRGGASEASGDPSHSSHVRWNSLKIGQKSCCGERSELLKKWRYTGCLLILDTNKSVILRSKSYRISMKMIPKCWKHSTIW